MEMRGEEALEKAWLTGIGGGGEGEAIMAVVYTYMGAKSNRTPCRLTGTVKIPPLLYPLSL